MIEDIKKVKIGKIDNNVNYNKFSAPTIDIYNQDLCTKMVNKFIQFAPKTKKENDTNAETDR